MFHKTLPFNARSLINKIHNFFAIIQERKHLKYLTCRLVREDTHKKVFF